MKNNIIFAIFIVVVILVLFMVSGTRSPYIPGDEIHLDRKTEQECLACHAEGMEHARKETHPPKDQCFICHKYSKKVRK